MRRTVMLLLIAGTSLLALGSSATQNDALATTLLLGSPVLVAALAVSQRQREAVVARVLLTLIAGIAVGQVLAVLLGPRVGSVEPFDSLTFFFLSFGIPVTVALCLIALVATPFEDEEGAVDEESGDTRGVDTSTS